MKLILLLVISFLYQLSNAQTKESKVTNLHYGISLSSTLSHTGIPIILTGEVETGHFLFYAGPKFSIWDTYISKNDPLGLNTGLRCNFLSSESVRKWNSFLNIDYSVIGYKSYSRNGKASDRGSFIHEYFFGYGLQVKLVKHLWISNFIGIGSYREYLFNVDLDKRFVYSGFNNSVKMTVTYKFN